MWRPAKSCTLGAACVVVSVLGCGATAEGVPPRATPTAAVPAEPGPAPVEVQAGSARDADDPARANSEPGGEPDGNWRKLDADEVRRLNLKRDERRPEVIQRIVREHFADLRACYEKGLMRDPTLRGRVLVHVRIEPDGSVSSSEAEPLSLEADAAPTSAAKEVLTLRDPDVRGCVAKQFGALTFPASTAVTTIHYPIHFESSD